MKRESDKKSRASARAEDETKVIRKTGPLQGQRMKRKSHKKNGASARAEDEGKES